MNDKSRFWIKIPAFFSIGIIFILTFMIIALAIPALTSGKISFENLFQMRFSIKNNQFGFLSLILGTLLTAGLALLFALPIALFGSICITRFLPKKLKNIVSTMIKILNTTPSVIFGFFGISIVFQFVKLFDVNSTGQSLLAGIVVLTFMLIPTLMILIITEIENTDKYKIEAGYALGMNESQIISKIIFTEIKKGIITASIISLGRAIGEASAVLMVSGNSPEILLGLKVFLAPYSSLTTAIAQNMGNVAQGFQTSLLYFIGLILLIMIFILNALITWVNKEK